MFHALFLALFLLSSLVSPALAWFRIACTTPLVSERIDPIISPGATSGHLHTVHGADAFSSTYDYDAQRNSSCTSCEVTQDLSNYWFPTLFFRDPATNYFERVGNGGLLVYYLYRGDGDKSNGGPGLTAFPPGLRMLSGDPTRRSKQYPAGLGTQAELAERAVQWSCLRYTVGLNQTDNGDAGFPSTDCEAGFQARLHFPSCWDGVNLDSADHKSHVAYLSGLDNGACPDTHQVSLIHLFYEMTWDIHAFADRWNTSSGQWPFVWATGDPTGFSLHGDFADGWDTPTLQAAIDYCNNPGDGTGVGITEDCPYLDVLPASTATQCKVPPVVDEVTAGTLSQLPGCNPLQSGPGAASMHGAATCPFPVLKDATVPGTTTAPPASPTPTSTGPVPTLAAAPDGWTTEFACAVDTSARILANVQTFAHNSMTATTCTGLCASKGMPYAGVEYGDECHCGTGYVGGQPPASAPTSDCSVPCAGESSQTCGAGWRIQVYAYNGTFAMTTTSARPAPAPTPAPLPAGWTTDFACAVDTSARILAGVQTFANSSMTTAVCTTLCASKGSPYAGMEYGDECHCGSGYVGGQPPASAPPSDCNMPCAGDATQVCGAGWRMQVYVYSGTLAASTTVSPVAPASPTPRPPPTITPTLLPTGWNTDFACAVDTPDRVLSHVQTHVNASLTPASCIALCLSKDPRYAYVGVEYGDECHCGTGYAGGQAPASAPTTDCNMPCAGDAAQSCGAGWRLQVYTANVTRHDGVPFPQSHGIAAPVSTTFLGRPTFTATTDAATMSTGGL